MKNNRKLNLILRSQKGCLPVVAIPHMIAVLVRINFQNRSLSFLLFALGTFQYGRHFLAKFVPGQFQLFVESGPFSDVF